MNNSPFFSITIPTYNRPNFLKTAIKSVLLQDFKDFEIVISDNSTSNESKIICQSFSDKRIRYFQNTDNIGFARNLYRAIKSAKGKYVFILGDDDLILKKDTLNHLYKIIDHNKYGYIRLKYVYHNNFNQLFSFADISGIEPKTLAKDVDNFKIYKFIFKSSFNFIPGLVFKNSQNITIPQLERTKDNNFQMEYFWIKFIYEQAKKNGAYIDLNDIVVSNWSTYVNPKFYYVTDNKIFLERSLDLIFPNLSPKEQEYWIRYQTSLSIPLLPSIKFYSNNSNLLIYIKRLWQLNPELIFSPKLYFYLVMALLMPKFLWTFMRHVVQRINFIYDNQLLAELKSLAN